MELIIEGILELVNDFAELLDGVADSSDDTKTSGIGNSSSYK